MKIPSRFPRHGGFVFVRSGCLGFLFTIGLLWGGGQMLYTALKNREPVTLTAKEYLAHRPDADWVHLKDTHCDLAECVTSGYFGAVSELYIPVRSPGEDPGGAIKVLLKTKNEKLVALMEQLGKAGKNPAEMAKIIKGNTADLAGPKEVTGLVEFGIESNDKKRSKLAGLHMSLAPDFVIIADGEKPSLIQGAAMCAGGLLLGVFMLKRTMRPKAV